MSPHQPARLGLLQISLAGVLWGTGGLAVQVIREAEPMSVIVISAYRMLIAAVVLVAAVLALRRLGSLTRLLRERPWRASLVGASTAAYQALYFGAVVQVGVSVATVLSLGLAPVLLTVGESVHARRLPAGGRVAVLAAALAGLLLVAVGAGIGETGPHPVLGVLAAAGSGSTYALTTVLGRPLAQRAGPLALTTTTTAVGALVLLPLALLSGSVSGSVSGSAGGPLLSSDPVVLATLAYLGVLTMALAYGLLYAGLRTTPGSSAVIATLLEPVTAALAAAAFLGERIGLAGAAGTGLILAAVAGLGKEPAVTPGGPLPARTSWRRRDASSP
ncbi:EamA family transporter [Nocardioides sp. cx-169]|uniref:DMT family transporter n=1 Tax=Nocardioides sp. cx-169 TaxID=2899080 RepID=UPI001E64F43C|nr:EamA family transporter [Nocardioides sp. cx-169]MCD4533339.1 EamA family transporter [Nocardioides sp. cx-169]